MNERLTLLNQELLKQSMLAAISEFASSYTKEISHPLDIVRANLQLVATGVGDISRRIEIATEHLNRISEIGNRFCRFFYGRNLIGGEA